MRLLAWLIRALLFFTLFAFALNNQETVSVKWFFGYEWRAPMVFVVLAAFTLGCLTLGLALAPRWWRYRRLIKQTSPQTPPDTPAPSSTEATPSLDASHSARHGV